ncbi:MAG: glutamate--tRNA ligase family protein [Candidatus Micrarchaeia archaeon]
MNEEEEEEKEWEETRGEEWEEEEKEVGELRDIREKIFAHALENAKKFGKASVESVIGKIIFENPKLKLKEKIGILKEEVKKVVEEVNKLSAEEIEERLREIGLEKEGGKEKGKKEGKGGEEREIKVKEHFLGYNTRFAPEPSGYLHLGHARAAILSYEIARRNGGKFILRFDDTNPKTARAEYVEQIKKDISWLGLEWDSESYSSDYMEIFYEKANELLKNDFAYVCECDRESIKINRMSKKECPCRDKPRIANIRDFERMMNGEELTLRLKGNMRSPNTALRDPILMRVIKEKHWRKNYFVWPSYDFSCPIMDNIENISHVLRDKGYELRDPLYKKICKILKLNVPHIISFSRLEVKNNTLSKREIVKIINERKIKFDDPRLLTLAGLRNRGISPKTIKKIIISLGLTKRKCELEMERILAENRKELDLISRRINFVKNPIELKIPLKKRVKIKFHPTSNLGEREILVDGKVYVQKEDLDEIIRLKDLATVKIKDGECEILEEEIKEYKNVKKVQWVTDYYEAVVKRPSDLLINGNFNENSMILENGICERYEPKIGETIQFIRYGFVKFDGKKDEKLYFTFSC